MEKYVSVLEMAERWEVTPRRIQILCNQNRINGVIKQSGVWLIPYGAKKPERNKAGKKNEAASNKLNVVSLFSGCGGMDLGFEGDFRVLKRAVNKKINPDWDCKRIDDNWVKLPKTRFHTVLDRKSVV